MRILVSESCAALANLLRLAERRGWDITDVANPEDTKFYVREVDYQLMFAMIAGRSVRRFDMIKTLGIEKTKCPIIAILERDCPIERAEAWQAGALICLTTAATQKEIEMAALSAIRFRASLQANVIESGCMALDLAKGEFRIAGQPAPFTRKQYLFLERLMLSKDRTVTRAQLMNHLYGFDTFPDGKILDVMICKLRAKLEHLGVDSTALETVWGTGFRLGVPTLRPAREDRDWRTSSRGQRRDAG